jgi:hypothetical protein
MWGASDPSKVSIETNTVNFGSGNPSYANAMVTTQAAGDVYIVAQSNGKCGATILHITEATQNDFTIGSERYTSGIILTPVSTGQLAHLDGGNDVACTNCHGPTAMNASYQTVEHTPLQTGGFSDDDLIGIFTMGMVPPGGYFDNSIVRQNRWAMFHRWTMTPDQAKGMVVYLRSLTPAPQTGKPNLPIRMRDGGGGPPPMNDAGGDVGGPGPGTEGGSGDDSSTDSGGDAPPPQGESGAD